MSFFVPFSSYESRLFLARRLAGVPGYQYDVDLSKEVFQRQIFNPDEIQRFITHFQNSPGHEYRRHMVFDEKMYLLEIKRLDELKQEESDGIEATLDNMDENRNVFGHYKDFSDDNNNNSVQPEKWDEDIKNLMEILDVKDPSELLITEVDEENYKMYLNDRKFKELSSRDQYLVKVGVHQTKMIGNRFVRPLYQASLTVYMYLMEKYLKGLKS
jgi:hypothetical protein